MKNWKAILMSPYASLRDAMTKIDAEAIKVALVVDAEQRLLGTITDGDIRRGLLAGMELTDPVERCMYRTPTTARVGESRSAILSKMRKLVLQQIPIIDQGGRVVDLKLIDDYLLARERENWVVIMAGGLGTRLKELTRNVPKPMLPVGNRPLLETVVCSLVEQGLRRIWMAVNYHASKIEEHFEDGQRFGAKISYLREEKRLGTAGALSLLPHIPEQPVLVTNGDLLANIDYAEIIDAHLKRLATATMAVREYEYQIPYGVVHTSEDNIAALEEKPVHQVMVNAGVYVLSPEALALVPKETFFDMPELFETVIIRGFNVCSHRLKGYWLDIGRHEDFLRANDDYTSVFK